MKIYLFDTTLRDGTQGEDVSFSLEDKLNIAKALDNFGIHYIEAGWPGSNPKDIEFFQRAKKIKFKNAKITAFGSTRKANVACEMDNNLQAILEVQPKVACIFGKSWDFHVKTALRTNLEENLKMISSSIRYLKKNLKEVIYDAEHFFDGYKNNPEYALKTIQVAADAGADFIVLCDTNGGALSWEIEKILNEAKNYCSKKIGIHAHNDGEMAVANSLVALRNGAEMVQGTINGIGERCGNANLISIIANLQLKMGYKILPAKKITTLSNLSHSIREFANLDEWKNQPFVGKSAFAHKGGIHVSAVQKNATSYEHIEPEQVGNSRRILVSELSGISNIRWKIKEQNFKINENDPELKKIVSELKKSENTGYSYEGADASLELLTLRSKKMLKEYFVLEGYQVYDGRRNQEKDSYTEASIKISVKEKIFHTASSGDGPVDALNKSLRKALSNFFPRIRSVHLQDYKVRILDKNKGTAAQTRVLITCSDGKQNWTTVGVDKDIIRASYIALTDSYIYKLYKTKA